MADDQKALACLGIYGESRTIAEIPLEELLGIVIRLAQPYDGPFAEEDLCVGEAMEGLDWVTEEHIQALCQAAGQRVLAALAAAGYVVEKAADRAPENAPRPDFGGNVGV